MTAGWRRRVPPIQRGQRGGHDLGGRLHRSAACGVLCADNIEELGSRRARRQGEHPQAGPSRLRPERLGEAQDERLGRTTDGNAGSGLKAAMLATVIRTPRP
ncbi:hypothetical protein ACWEO2_31150 [Nocardia sp. NPDC004278]